jgi:hypothetical protein
VIAASSRAAGARRVYPLSRLLDWQKQVDHVAAAVELDARPARVKVGALRESLERRCDEFVDGRRLP